MSSSVAATSTIRTSPLWWGLLLLAGVATLAFFYAVSQRLFYPHELEWMEGALADHASRIADGLPLYCEPQAEHVPFLYAPLLFWLGGLGMKLGLDGVFALRLVAVAFSIGSALLIGHWVRQATGKVVPGLVAIGMFFAGYGWLAWWYDLARNDSLFVFLCLATAYQLRYGGNRQWLWAGLLAALALLAKQSALMWLPAAGVGALCWNWRIAVRFGLVAIAAMVASIGLLHVTSDGWSTFYLFEMPRHHGWVGEKKLGYWTEDLAPMLPLVLLGLVGFAITVRRDYRSALFLAAFGSGGIACSWLSRMHVGGFDNVMMYGFAGACVLGPTAAAHSSRIMRVVGPLALMLSFALLGYEAWQRNPNTTLLPSAAHRQAHEELRAFVQTQAGPVWIPAHGHIAYRQGKGTGAHGQAIFDVLQMLPPGPGGFDISKLADPTQLHYLSARAQHTLRALMANVDTALVGRRFATIIADRFGPGDGVDAWTGLFLASLVGADGVLGTKDDPYVVDPKPLLSQPNAIKPLLGYEVRAPQAWLRRD